MLEYCSSAMSNVKKHLPQLWRQDPLCRRIFRKYVIERFFFNIHNYYKKTFYYIYGSESSKSQEFEIQDIVLVITF